MNNILPNLIIIGAMKSGTSSLHNYLNLHPEIQMSSLKELDFFILEKNWNQGLDWYSNQFPMNKEAKIFGESSPNYTKSHIFADVPQRMASVLPDAKLIYILRDPIKRILSHYFHQFVDRQEMRSLIDALQDNNNNYINSSRYYWQLKDFLSIYKLDQVLILTLEELEKNRNKTLQKVFDFLGVDSSFEHPAFLQNYHLSSEKRRLTNLGHTISKLPFGLRFCNLFLSFFEEKIQYPVLDEQVLMYLKSVLSEDIAQLRALTGLKFSDWYL
ncbi:sulfotransferase [Anabaena cylindrica UHCC 0172]|uniref:sulfotransferase family protein n=1 Tax=Anabaena cylindrica TaxID=1165 RepID=UPI002B2136F4|nr:sulfotransferase [Anabaena cylindrica]MEA5553505.1 sulfotransferase [Anabaena cylindrica UHCC 0172]